MGRAGRWINGDKRACHVDRNFKVVWFEMHITLGFVENTVRPVPVAIANMCFGG